MHSKIYNIVVEFTARNCFRTELNLINYREHNFGRENLMHLYLWLVMIFCYATTAIRGHNWMDRTRQTMIRGVNALINSTQSKNGQTEGHQRRLNRRRRFFQPDIFVVHR